MALAEAKTKVTLREATAADVPVLVDLVHAAFEEYRGKLDPPSGAHAETEESIERLLARERAVLAVDGDRPIGCIFYAVRETEVYLHRLSVLPSHRRQGVGRVLVEYVEDRARSHGPARVTLGLRTVLVGNLLFYEELGYTVAETRSHPGYTLPTMFLIQKWLDRPQEHPKRLIEVVPHDPAWSHMYAEEAARLAQTFGDELVAIHHIGSTAIASIYAKPVIDILPEVRDIEQVDRLNPALVALGYRPRGENGIPGRRFFVRSQVHRTHHVHVFPAGHPEVARHVDFVAYLNAHPEDALRYSQLKQELARQFPHDIDGYIAGKSSLIAELDAEARAWRSAQVAQT